jgi:hypothetical protein
MEIQIALQIDPALITIIANALLPIAFQVVIYVVSKKKA